MSREKRLMSNLELLKTDFDVVGAPVVVAFVVGVLVGPDGACLVVERLVVECLVVDRTMNINVCLKIVFNRGYFTQFWKEKM